MTTISKKLEIKTIEVLDETIIVIPRVGAAHFMDFLCVACNEGYNITMKHVSSEDDDYDLLENPYGDDEIEVFYVNMPELSNEGLEHLIHMMNNRLARLYQVN